MRPYLNDLFGLEGQVALVTGSTRGIGFAIAQGLGRAGAKVILNGRNQNSLDRAIEELSKENIEVFGALFDVTKKDQISNSIIELKNTVGPIDILVNNAGVSRLSLLLDVQEEDWHVVLDTILTGAFLVAQQVALSMVERKNGKIINICSLMSELGRVTTGPYTAAKGGLKMLTKAMATEWGQYNIQVNGIGPGYFNTDLTRERFENPEFNSWVVNMTPTRRWGDVTELVGAAIFLASKASSFVNGQILYVDGGILAAL